MKRGCVILLIVAILVVCLVIAIAGALVLMPAPSRPAVQINAPRNGEQIAVGQQTLVQALARDEQKIRRVELWVDGQLLDAQTTNLPGGISPFPIVTPWQARTAGTHTLVVRAFNTTGGRGQATIVVNAVDSADRDHDGVPDARDACPDQPGADARGCRAPSATDRDGDGVADSADACPDQPGSPLAQGCPDADSDGVRDNADACPREPGTAERNGCPVPGDADGDGVVDANDACPREPGSPSARGCPDNDDDGIVDRDDACPDAPGTPGLSGCPDRDGDGVRDVVDLCPDVPGPASNAGCPPTGAGDRDRDGVDDGTDLAPGDAGSADSGGAPAPGSDDVAPSNPLDDMGFAPPAPPVAGVTFEALEFQVARDYNEVYCYGGLGGAISVVERFGPFRTLGARRWDIAEYLGGANSRFVTLPLGEPLQGFLECVGYVQHIIPGEGGEETPFNLGSIRIRHAQGDWDGHTITQDSSGGASGHSFRATYRLCRGTCRNTDFPPPFLHLYSIGGRRQFVWVWEGNRANMDGFKLYVGNMRVRLRASQSSFWAPGYLQPPCGERYEFRLTAFRGDRESPFSNTVYWSGEQCPRTMRLTFDRIRVGGNWGMADEWNSSGEVMGPIYGAFWASGSGSEQVLAFDAATIAWPLPITPVDRGLFLRINQEWSIQRIFDWIHRERAGCIGLGCPSYSAPGVNYVTIGLGPRDDLTFGGRILDLDLWSRDDTIFNTAGTLRNTDLPQPGERRTYTLRNRNIELVVQVETLSGP